MRGDMDGRPKTTMDVEDYQLLCARADLAAEHFDRWLEDAVGMRLRDARIRSVTLGEGYITCERIATDTDGKILAQGDEVVTFVSTHQASLPSVWVTTALRATG